MSAPQRTCGGCGGSGRPDVPKEERYCAGCEYERSLPGFEDHGPLHTCPRQRGLPGLPARFRPAPCPVCAGRGTVDAKASRADAVADAETLLLNYPGVLGANDSMSPMDHPEYWAERAALAVPGLREERCPKIPEGYGTNPEDCACGNCPEARRWSRCAALAALQGSAGAEAREGGGAMRVSKSDRDEALESLHKWIKPGDTVYTVLDHVSRSGMSRWIRVLVPYTRDDGMVDFVHPNHAVQKVLGLSRAKRGDGSVVGGCGMDMGFHLVYELGRRMWPEGFGCVGEKCRSNDHSNGDRDRTPNPHGQERCHDVEGCKVPEHWHRDGGYALQSRWL